MRARGDSLFTVDVAPDPRDTTQFLLRFATARGDVVIQATARDLLALSKRLARLVGPVGAPAVELPTEHDLHLAFENKRYNLPAAARLNDGPALVQALAAIEAYVMALPPEHHPALRGYVRVLERLVDQVAILRVGVSNLAAAIAMGPSRSAFLPGVNTILGNLLRELEETCGIDLGVRGP